MPPVIATASGLVLLLLSLFGGVWSVAFGIAGPLVRGIDCVRLDARLGVVFGGRLGLIALRSDFGDGLLGDLGDGLVGERLRLGRLLLTL
jgi:hypothetical protein